ncbi:MAG: hypothetical protein LV479_02410 [Methylacidiphilales bacterium]|nr:hypothetical protein [Candidatus Methylacidiphilales bacterium]
MPFISRCSFLCSILLFFGLQLAFAADAKPAPLAAPTQVDSVTFTVNADGEKHKVVVWTSPILVRVDIPEDGYSILYDPKTDFYTGLEHRNYTYWTFSWPEVRNAVESSKRYETRLQDLGNQGMNSSYAEYQAQAAGTNVVSSGTGLSDDSGYVWQETNDHQRVAGIDCVRWTGQTQTGEGMDVWATSSPLPQIRAALDRLRIMNEPMALVPIRTLVPPSIFPVCDALTKGGMTPVEILWGSDQDKNSFAFVKAETRTPRADFFSVPKLYMKTTLITMDGMIDQKTDDNVDHHGRRPLDSN